MMGFDLQRAVRRAAPLVLLSLAACGGGNGGNSSAGTGSSYLIGGTLSGLGSTPVALQNTGGEIAVLGSNGSFTFQHPASNGSSYNISVHTQPARQTCTVTSGAGTVSGHDVTNVAVACSAGAYTVGGTITGLSGTLVLQNNAGDTLNVNANGNFSFATALAQASAYNVTVLTQPSGQSCSIANGSGAMGWDNVTNIAITCASNSYTVGGSVGGLNGTLVLQNNGRDNISVSTNGAFTFPAAVLNGNTYSVAILAQPAGQTCAIGNGAGTINGGNSNAVAITCTNNRYTVGGTVSGLSGTLVLQNNGGDNLSLSTNGAFTFTAPVAFGSAYGVSILTQPAGQTCSVSSGTGTMPGTDVGNISIVCSANTYTIGGTVSGLSGTLVLLNNGGDTLNVSANGTFTFASRVPAGGTYQVTAQTQPTGQGCTIANGTGTVNAGNVTNISITCTANNYTVGGSISGLNGTVVLQNNGGNNLTLNTNGSFTFPATVSNGNAYNVTVLTQPAGQTCIATGSGTIQAANVTNVSVSCSTNTYSIGGSVSGLSGTVVLQNNGGNNLTVNANGSFTFSTPVAYGGGYIVTVLTQPAGQTCTVSAGSGSVSTANVSSVSLVCSNNSYTLGGTISGLSGTVVLQNNLGNNLTRSTNGAFTFGTPIAFGSPYSVTVLTQPTGQTCSVSAGTGTMSSANISNVAVVCSTNTYTVGGSISGLTGSLVLQNNGGDNLSVGVNGNFTFATRVAYGGAYGVSVLTQPANQNCSVANGAGTMGAGNVTGVAVSCATNAFTVGGTASGLSGSAVLRNGADSLTVTTNGAFTFPLTVLNGTGYNVTVQTPPAGQHCRITNGSGTMGWANITNVSLVCINNQMGGAIQKDVPLTQVTNSYTLAGNAGAMGSADNPNGTLASFSGSKDVTTDGVNLYVVDGLNDTIRQVVITTGAVTTLAGTATGTGVSADGIGAAAQFNTPKSITTDGTNLYVTDSLGDLIRKIVIATGQVSTLAGNLNGLGTVDGIGTAASFSYAYGITTDGSNLYVTDQTDHVIRKIVIATGQVSTLAGVPSAATGCAVPMVDGAATVATFCTPQAITTDGKNLYVADGGNFTIRKIDLATNQVSTLAGIPGVFGSTDGPGATATFDLTKGITSDGINLYVTDNGNGTIRKVEIATGTVTTIAGTAGIFGYVEGLGAAIQFSSPWGITTDGSKLFVVDYSSTANNKVRVIR